MSKTILVTGGTKGIGKEILERFMDNGFDGITCSRNEQELLELKEEMEDRYPKQKLTVKEADLSNKDEVQSFAAFVKETSHPEILVNNTGIFIPGAIHSEPDGNFELIMKTNLFSVYYLTREFAAEMVRRRHGHIFNMGSIAGMTAYANGGSYAISKWALRGFSQGLRQELMEHNIRVTSILAGATYTASWEGAGLPEERFIKATDVAETVWMASNLSANAVVEEIIIRPQLGDI